MVIADILSFHLNAVSLTSIRIGFPSPSVNLGIMSMVKSQMFDRIGGKKNWVN